MSTNDLNACNSINSITTTKFIIKHIKQNTNNANNANNANNVNANINDNDIKLIFIGYQPEKIKAICSKLETKVILKQIEKPLQTPDKSIDIEAKLYTDILTPFEILELESVFPHYIKTFGILSIYNVFFVYKYIEDNIPIAHIRIILYEIIKTRIFHKDTTYETETEIDTETDKKHPRTKTISSAITINQHIKNYIPSQMLIYKYAKTIDYTYFVNMINYIYGSNKHINNETFFNQLYKITYMSKDAISKKIKFLLAGKYSGNITFIQKFINTEYFNYEETLNSEEVFHLLMSIPIILTTKYYYNENDILYNYYGYQNIEYIIEKYKNQYDTHTITNTEIKFRLEHNINSDSNEFLYMNLNSFNKTLNNEYFIILKNDMKEIVSKDILEFYYPEEVESKYKLGAIACKQIYNHYKLQSVNTSIINDSSIIFNNCYCKNIIFESLSNNIKIKYNLANLYNNMTTSYYHPVIKYYGKGGIEKYIKMNKTFLQKHTYQELNTLIRNQNNPNIPSNQSKQNALNNMEYIQWKWYFDKQYTNNNLINY